MGNPTEYTGTGATLASWEEIYSFDRTIEDVMRRLVSQPDDELVRQVTELMKGTGIHVQNTYEVTNGVTGLVIGVHQKTGQRLEVILTERKIVYRRQSVSDGEFVMGQSLIFYSKHAKRFAIFPRRVAQTQQAL